MITSMVASPLEPCYLPLDGLDGERFHATSSTVGPWFPHAQHVGPPTALLVRAVERVATRSDAQLTRLTVEVLGPVPTGEITVTTEVQRSGRTIELIGAELSAEGRAVLRASAWRTAITDTSAVAGPDVSPLPRPGEGELQTDRPAGWLGGYLDALEWRWVRGTWGEPGDGAVWARLKVPLVAGEEPTPLQRLAAVVDSGNGISGRLDLGSWLYVNVDLTVHLHRSPVGEWIGIDAQTVLGPTGAGTATSTVFDENGHVGRGAQALVVRPR